jgi:hypothetical protein
MFKTFFTTRQPKDTVDLELEHAMELIHNRMERMLEAESIKRVHLSILQKTPSYYHTH